MEHLAMYPVDTIKTRMQASTSSAQMPSASFVRNLQVIATREGLKGFYRGAAAVAVSAGPAHALYFATYERIKELCVPSETAAARRRRGGRASASELAGYSVAGATATMASDAIATPLDVVKQRMQLAHTNYRSVFECASRILRKEGFGAFFRSYRTTVAMNVPYTIVHFPVYEFAKRFLEPERQSSSLLQAIEEEFDEDEAGAEGNEGTWTHLLAGGAAGGVAAAITTPMDVVKTRMQIGMDCAGYVMMLKFVLPPPLAAHLHMSTPCPTHAGARAYRMIYTYVCDLFDK